MNTESQQQIAREKAKDFCENHGLHEHFIGKDLERAFLSAIERATKVASGDVKRQITLNAQPQRIEQQGWTPEYLDSFWADCDCETALFRATKAIKAALAAERQRREQAEQDCAKSKARMSERKSVHQWLTEQGIPEEENGKRICLLRRLRITLDRLSETENEVEGLKDANRGLYIESNERYQQLLSAQAAIEAALKAPWTDVGVILAPTDLSLLHKHDAEVRKPLVALLRKIQPWLSCDDAREIDEALEKAREVK